MKATQVTTFAVNGQTFSKTLEIPVTLEADETRHLESNVLNLYPDITFQTIEGFGGAITESVASLMETMSPQTRKEFLNEYFSPEGNRYKFIRMPIDSCDYSLEEHAAVADPMADPEFKTFSIDRDLRYGIRAMKEAMEISPEPLSILLSPWSPPACWKTPPAKPKNDASVYGGDFFSSMMPPVDYEKPQRCNGGSLKPEHYGD